MLFELSLTQFGLLLDAVGFIIIFLFGGFSFGLDFIVLNKESWYVLAAKIVGGAMVVTGFALQFFGATV